MGRVDTFIDLALLTYGMVESRSIAVDAPSVNLVPMPVQSAKARSGTQEFFFDNVD